MNKTKAYALEITMPQYEIGTLVKASKTNNTWVIGEIINIRLEFEGSITWDREGGCSSYVPKNVLRYTILCSDNEEIIALEDELSLVNVSSS